MNRNLGQFRVSDEIYDRLSTFKIKKNAVKTAPEIKNATKSVRHLKPSKKSAEASLRLEAIGLALARLRGLDKGCFVGVTVHASKITKVTGRSKTNTSYDSFQSSTSLQRSKRPSLKTVIADQELRELRKWQDDDPNFFDRNAVK